MKRTDKATLHFLRVTADRTKWNIRLLVLLQAVLGGSAVGFALLLRGIINAAVAGQRSAFFGCLAGFAALICFQLLCRFAGRLLEEATRIRLENRFKRRLFACLLEKEFAAVTAVHSGDWVTRLTSDTVVVADGMAQIIPGVAGMAVKLVGAVAAILLLEPRFCWLLLPGGALVVLLSVAFRSVSKRLHKEVQQQDGRLRMFLSETLGSLLVVRSYGVEDPTLADADSKMEAHRHARIARAKFSNLCNTGFGVLMNGAYLLGAAVCGYGILVGSMSYGSFAAILELIGQVQSPFANISGFLPRWYAMLASAERLMEAEDLPSEEAKLPYSLAEVRRCYETDFQGFGLIGAAYTYAPPVRGMADGQAAEQSMPVVLHDISLAVHKGDYVAFTGPSGCGKSTVLKLLLCLYPLDSGERYLLDSGERQPLTAAWQKLFAYVPQGNHLMSGTIREVVAFSDRAAAKDDERLWQALKIACADGFVAELPDGVDTLLGERGLGLSEGQMQRLAIARAVFSQHPVLMLDECTSALDAATEQQVLRNLRAMTDKTVLIVTHRPAALEICDVVVRFDTDGCTMCESSGKRGGPTNG